MVGIFVIPLLGSCTTAAWKAQLNEIVGIPAAILSIPGDILGDPSFGEALSSPEVQESLNELSEVAGNSYSQTPTYTGSYGNSSAYTGSSGYSPAYTGSYRDSSAYTGSSSPTYSSTSSSSPSNDSSSSSSSSSNSSSSNPRSGKCVNGGPKYNGCSGYPCKCKSINR